MWNRLQERYEGKTVINKFSFVSNVLNMRYRRDQNMADYTAVLESHFARLAFMITKFDDCTKLGILIAALKSCSEFKLMITSMGVTEDDHHTCMQMF